MQFNKNDTIVVTIEDMGTDGEGIGKVEGYILFIKDTIIGDIVEAKIMKAKKNYAYARLEKVITPSPFRVEPKCAFYKQCGGCQIQAMDYSKQLEYKQNKVRNHLVRIGGFDETYIETIMEPIVGMEDPYRYRNKAQYPVGTNREGRIITGFYASRTHSIVSNTDCYLGAKENKLILDTIVKYMEECKVSAYQEETGVGLVRHILIRTGFATKEIMVCLVVNGNRLPKEEVLINYLSNIENMTSVSINTNTEKTNVIMGQKIRTLWGSDTITDTISMEGGSIAFKISPLSFYQVNPAQTEKLYRIALDYASLTGEETVWDLYCGIGTISLFLASKAKQVYGVEVIPEAIEDAKENARINGIKNAEFFVGKVEEVLPGKYENENIYADVIVVDPPRKGCDEICLATIIKMQPKRIVYVSCDSATLARDLKILCASGYKLEKVRPVDQFGHTVHVETVVLLSQQKPSDRIVVDLDLDELDVTSAETKATYNEIQQYVLKETGLMVSNLYIAQVKKKCGIDVGESFNKPKSENARQPKCPAEKEKAIKDALEHFGMI